MYDAIGQLVATINANDEKVSNTYDADGRLNSTTTALGLVTSYEYEVPKKQIGQVRYANKTMLKQAVTEHYPRMEEPDHAGLSRQRLSIRQKGEEDGSV